MIDNIKNIQRAIDIYQIEQMRDIMDRVTTL